MKKTILIFAVVLCALGAWHFLKEPKFQGPNAKTQQALWMLSKGKYKEPKYTIAKRISSQVQYLQFTKTEPRWSSVESKSILEAQNYSQEIETLANEFESNLSTDEVAKITQKNPYSLFRSVNMLWSQMDALECTKEEFDKLLKQIDPAEFASKGKAIAVLVDSTDRRFMKDYIEMVTSMITTEPKYQKYKVLAQEFYPTKLNPDKIMPENLKALSFGDSSEREFTHWRESLIKSGVPEASVETYAIEKAKLSPACLGKLVSVAKPWFREATKNN